MANIQISELAGAELLQDSESFLNELSDRELSVMGGDFSVVGNTAVESANTNGNTANANTIGNNNSAKSVKISRR